MNFKFAAAVTYIGRNYCGWQRQPFAQAGSISIQETIENALSQVVGQPTKIQGSGRTDSGVNATGQVFHFNVESEKWNERIFFQALNSLLPDDIRILWVKSVNSEFHAQKSALKKQYSYYFLQGPTALPWYDARACWHKTRLDVVKMQNALNGIVGEFDFKVFQASGAKPSKTTVRRILEGKVERVPLPDFPDFHEGLGQYDLVRIRLVGTGFLKQMVRSIAGSLRWVGEGYRPETLLVDLIHSQKREEVGPTAPANGLWLERVWYP